MRAPLLILATLAAGLAGCLEAPLSDPETAKVDEKLVGLWRADDEQGKPSLIAVAPYDARTYLITWHGYEKDGDAYKATGQTAMKGWLTEVGGARFLNLRLMNPSGLVEPNPKPYFVMRLDQKDDAVTLRSIDPKFVADAKTPEALGRIVKDNLDKPELYLKPGAFRRVPAGEREQVKAILKAFD